MILPKIKPEDAALYYEIHGEGTSLLLIPGLGSDGSSWGSVVTKLAGRFKVISLDNRGAGRSEVPATGYTVAQMAGDAVRLLDHLQIKKAHVLGHSLGGYIAQELAIDHPERVERLILESTAPVSSERNNALFLKFFRQLRDGGNAEAWFREWTRWLFSPECLGRKTFIEAFVKHGADYPYAPRAVGFRGQIEAIASFDSRAKLGRIKAQTLVMVGKEDRLIFPKEAETLAKGIPGSLFQCIKDVGHCIHIENRDLFIKVVGEYLVSK